MSGVTILKDKGGKQHNLPFVGSNLLGGWDIFEKEGTSEKDVFKNRGLRHLCILCIGVSRKFYVKPVCLIIFWL